MSEVYAKERLIIALRSGLNQTDREAADLIATAIEDLIDEKIVEYAHAADLPREEDGVWYVP